MSCNTCPPSPIPPWYRPTVMPITHTLVEDGAISLNTNTTYLDCITLKNPGDPTEPYIATLADGNYQQQRKAIMIPAGSVVATAPWRVTGNFVGFVSLLFNDVGQSVELIWDGAGWHYVSGNAIKEDA